MTTPVLELSNVNVHFAQRNAWGKIIANVQAVRGVSLSIHKGETVGLVGESGCGKSTLAKAIVRLVDVTSGAVDVNGQRWSDLSFAKLRPLRPQVQMVFQDPYSSLNPRMRIGKILAEPLLIHQRGDKLERAAKVAELLEQVGLHPDAAQKFPHEFSGGQRQRIGIARAVILQPDVLLADEAVSALDVSVQAQVLNLLADLQNAHGHSMLFISHDLRVVEQISDRVLVMYLGRIVESGHPQQVFQSPKHPYTKALLDAVPEISEIGKPPAHMIKGEPPSPASPPSGCAFRTRCPFADEQCVQVDPKLQSDQDNHSVACHHPLHA